uniref:Uncharacterized protein n=1 Tax=Nonomuraea gerenzanensis TaxID=93944 RepID=A0A1M4ENM2_9ACTN|nr:hypothetical protein BN4615_P9931 [Nonomuraea gerenzanensis]
MPQCGGPHELGVAPRGVRARPHDELFEQGSQLSGGYLDAICHALRLVRRGGSRLPKYILFPIMTCGASPP